MLPIVHPIRTEDAHVRCTTPTIAVPSSGGLKPGCEPASNYDQNSGAILAKVSVSPFLVGIGVDYQR